MIYGDLGRYPLNIAIKKIMISFWHTLLINNNKLSSFLYNAILESYVSLDRKYKWIDCIKKIFDDTGLIF